MHQNLERRLAALEVARIRLGVATDAVSERYALLFDALAVDLGITRTELGTRLGFDPMPDGGNRIVNGKADPSPEDCFRLVDVWLKGKGVVGERRN